MSAAERNVKVIERRNEPRVRVSEPVRLRPVTDPVSSEQLAEAVNMSEHGLYVATNIPLKVGMQVELFLRIPREVSGEKPVDVRCLARVMHVDTGAVGGKAGVGMCIERYEPLKMRDRWVS
jgi:PilZ domain-containing protein